MMTNRKFGAVLTGALVAGGLALGSPAASADAEAVPSVPQSVSALGGIGWGTIRWAPPADDGGAAVTGYTVSVSGGPTYDVGPSTRSKRFTGLSGNTDYTFTVRANNADGAGPGYSAKLIGTRIVLDRLPSPITYGTTVRVSGQAFRSDGSTGSSWTVELQGQKVGSESWGTIASQRVNWAGGGFGFNTTPSSNYRYRVVYGSDNTKYLGSISNLRGVNVRTKVTGAFDTDSMTSRGLARFAGSVAPSHAWRKVELQILVDGGWEHAGTKTLNADSRYSAYFSFAPGTYYIRARMPAHEDHYAGYSPADKIVVS